MNLLFKRILLATACVALGIGGGYFMATELFQPGQWERAATMQISAITYLCAWIIGDKLLRSKPSIK